MLSEEDKARFLAMETGKLRELISSRAASGAKAAYIQAEIDNRDRSETGENTRQSLKSGRDQADAAKRANWIATCALAVSVLALAVAVWALFVPK